MFRDLIKISNRKYKIYKRNESTKVISFPSEYSLLRDLNRDNYMYCFSSNFEGKQLLCFSEIEIKGTIKIKISSAGKRDNKNWYRLTVPKIIHNIIKHSDNNYYEAYHNNKGLLIFEQKEE